MSKVEIVNVGAVRNLRIDAPEQGGVVVLRGRNGSGKSTALEAIQAAATGTGTLAVRDGEKRGEVKAFGATVVVQKSTRHAGEVEVATLEGPGDVSTLVDPGVKDEQSADVRRIRALLALIGAKCDATAFHGLLGGADEFNAIVAIKSTTGDDPIQLADRIKRDIEAAARVEEQAQEKAAIKAAELRRQNEGVDLTAEHDADRLSEAWQMATADRADKSAKATAYERAVVARAEAAAKLKELQATAPNIASLEASQMTIANQLEGARHRVERLEQELVAARVDVEAARAAYMAATDKLQDAVRSAAMLSNAEKAVEASLPERVTADDVAFAEAQQAAARANMERGVKVREAMAREFDAAHAFSQAATHDKQATRYRKAAQGVDGVLSAMVGKACSLLRVEAGRLVLTTERGTTYFGELSHGERWKIALDVAIEAVGRGGVLVCPQEAWEGLDPVNRQAIAQHLHGTGVVMFTAEAGDGAEISARLIEG